MAIKFEVDKSGKVTFACGMATVKRIREIGLVQASRESKFESLEQK